MKKECDQCAWDDKKRIAKYECELCGGGACEKHFMTYNGDCADCPPPQYREIKKVAKKKSL